ncbi:MAG: PAS domain S-box protein [SAR324 cluster bacterium]|nr:PAS domain S-box protein [SAR324 cluster bacterium]
MNDPTATTSPASQDEKDIMGKLNYLVLFLMGLIPLWLTSVVSAFGNQPQHLVVGSELDFPPYALVNETGEADGFSVDLMKAVAKVMNLDVEFRVGPWNVVRQELEENKIDALLLVSDNLKPYVSFELSETHTVAHDAFFARKGHPGCTSLDDLSGKRILVMQADAAHEELIARGFAAQILATATIDEALQRLSQGEGDCALMPHLTGLLTLKKLKLNNLQTSSPPLSEYHRNFCFAVSRGNSRLLELFKQGIVIIHATGQYDEIYEKWFGVLLSEGIDWKRWLEYGAGFIFIFMLLLTGVLVWNRALQRQVAEEIKKYRLSQENLKQSEQQIHLFFEQPLMGMAILTPDAGWLAVNDRLCELLGYSREELLKMKWSELTHPDDLADDLEQYNRIFSGETEGFSLEKRYLRKDGQVMHALISVQGSRNPEGTVEYFYAMVQDITMRKQYLKALLTNNELLERVFATTHFCVVYLDTNFNFIRVNKAYAQACGYPTEFFSGKNLFQLYPDAENETIFQEVITTGNTFTIQARSFRFSDHPEQGVTFWDWTVHPLLDANGDVEALLFVLLDVTESTRLKENLLETRELLNEVQKISKLGGWKYDVNMRRLIWTDEVYAIYGVSPDYDPNNIARDIGFFHHEDMLTIGQAFENAVHEGTPYDLELRFIRMNGERLWVRTMGTPILENNRVVRVLGNIMDITDRKETELRLLRQETELKEAQRIAHVGNWTLDVKTNHVFWSEELYHMLGLDPSEPPPDYTYHSRLFTPESWECLNTHLSLTRERGIPYELELEMVRKDGSKGWMLARGESINNEKREVIGLRGMAQDITERKRIEAKLKESETRFRTIAEWANVGFSLVVDRQQRWVNQKCAEIFQYPKEDLENQTTRKLYPSQEAYEQFGKEAYPILSAGQVYESDQPLLRRDGTTIWVHYNGKAIDPDDMSQGTIWALEDITERKRNEEALKQAKHVAEQALRSKAEFLANMSHEIRTPLNGVIGMTSLLMTTPLDETQQDYARTIQLSSDHLLTLINNILDFSKIESGKMALENEPFEIHELIEQTMRLMEGKALEKNIELRSHISQDVPLVLRGDVTRIRQILINLLGNALKFTQTGSVVVFVGLKRLSLLKEPGLARVELLFSVRDTGIGIPADKIDRLFQEFSQIDASTTRKYGGSGLGLTISKRLVELMQGKITVESIPGHGSTFSFTLSLMALIDQSPLKTNEAGSPLDQNGIDSEMAQKRSLRILLAEDNPVNQKMTLLMLEKLGYSSDVAINGLEVLELLKQKTYDVIFMDIQMPDMDGLEATRQIVAQYSPPNRPWIIAMTANALPGDREVYLQAGMDDYLSKPMTLQSLMKALNQYSDHRTIEPEAPTGKDSPVSSDTGNIEPEELLDFNLLNELQSAVGLHVFQQMRTLFEQQMTEALPEFQHFINIQERAPLRRIAHKLKGSAICIGVIQLKNLLNQLQYLSDSIDPDPLPELLRQLQQSFDHTMQLLKDWEKTL